VIKIAPDISPADILTMASVFKEHKVDGIITTNTTVDRFNLTDHHAEQQGGLSGQPLFEKSTQILASIKAALGETNIPLIASGGIMSPDQARAKAEIGADLIQLYTGLIYEGPGLIASSATALNAAYFDQPDKKCQID
jgi:dihydroorotate dehydrogenase